MNSSQETCRMLHSKNLSVGEEYAAFAQVIACAVFVYIFDEPK